MDKSNIQKIKVDINADGESALSIMLCKDGTVGRQGNGNLPAHNTSIMGMIDSTVFQKTIEQLDEDVFPHHGLYDHPNKIGIPINYKISFQGSEPHVKSFEFRLGMDNKDVGNLLPYFDQFIQLVVAQTESWYQSTLEQQPKRAKPWWKFW